MLQYYVIFVTLQLFTVILQYAQFCCTHNVDGISAYSAMT